MKRLAQGGIQISSVDKIEAYTAPNEILCRLPLYVE